MSRPIYEPSLARADQALAWGSRQLFRQPAPTAEGTSVCPTFRASIPAPGDSPFPFRRTYSADQDAMDTVFWDMWENGNSNYFDEFIVPSGNDAGKLSAVDLLIPGIYLIFVRIDWDDFFEGQVRIGTNYDDSYVITKEHGDTAFSFYGPDGDTQMRYLGIDQTSAQNFVEIAVGHNDPTAADHTIPGNSEGAWAQYPELVITYLCDPGLTGFPFSS